MRPNRGHYIDGRWREPLSGRRYGLPNPATGEPYGEAPDGSREDMRDAIAAARRALDEGPWRKAGPAERARVLARLADELERRKEDLRQALIGAHGATGSTHAVQLELPLSQLRACADLVLRFPFEEPLPSPAGVRSLLLRQPVGVCGLLPTWNFPLYVSLQKVAPALGAGCTVVVKPSPLGPLVDLILAEAIEACDLPPGVFNVVVGESDDLGRELCESPLVDKISFTGSTATGKRILEAAARTCKRVHLELGGKSAVLVLDDADLDAALPAIAAPAYFHAGQGCALRTRVLVSRRRHDDLVQRLRAFLGRIRVGDPADPAVALGPLIREERRQAVRSHIAAGVAEGATLVAGGDRPAHLPHGYFVEATLFAGVTNEMRIAREEIFGPVLCVLPYDDEDDAVRIANDSRYGLAGGILTPDIERGLALARRLRVGGVSIGSASNPHVAPFGGWKESGLGREGGTFGIAEFTEVQSLTWPG
jgi:aldehyde dehydrogenase (NAD+)